ncbi:marine proteobacterial sortase target protein [Desulfopila sp. IMCC35008]|uniref:marine proteobacterial sortase target protein n=1 Tax=Desulfopila sp. IMCC35008 TaxID=2653858 RepID=UPI0013D3B809|nr:marine proteobacterial sortase target protein [Desulfopila sp. IMCC35008]
MKGAPAVKPVTDTQEKKRRRVSLDPGNMMLLLYPVAILIILLLAGMVRASVHNPEQADRDMGEFTRGELLLPDKTGQPVPAVMLRQDVNITITGIGARVKVVQEFVNRGDDWVNGIYVFPLPHESAVDRLKMKIGEREITGVIKEKEEAEAIYKKAASEGRKTSLLSQNRPNMFTTRVANIGPGEKIVLIMEYQQVARFEGNVFSLRFPLAITPRYIPGTVLPANEGAVTRKVSFDSSGWARNTDQVPDASDITPRQVQFENSGQPPVNLTVDIAAGFPLARLESMYHQVQKEEQGENHYRLTAQGSIAADRDFVLEWVPQNSKVAAALFHEELGSERYLLLMLMPPHEMQVQEGPREVVFVLDVSGSMAGRSIVQAKEALGRGLGGLRPQDRFNIISFSSSAHAMFDSSRMATATNLGEAKAYLAGLQAGGGTEMYSALSLALTGEEHPAFIRQVVFLTDGAVGNEQALLGLVRERLGDSRLFTVGIGSAPNDYFMTRAATMGRGSFTYIGDVGEVRNKMDTLLRKLRYPSFTDIRVKKEENSGSMELYPNPVPDLYHGEPLILALRGSQEEDSLIISGKAGGREVEIRADISTSGSRPGVAALWGRKKIRNLMENLALGADGEMIRQEVVATALHHRLVSRYTSLVAVDNEVSRPADKLAKTHAVPTPVPRGLQMDAVFGGGARTATPSTLLIIVGFALMGLAFLAYCCRGRRWDRLS